METRPYDDSKSSRATHWPAKGQQKRTQANEQKSPSRSAVFSKATDRQRRAPDVRRSSTTSRELYTTSCICMRTTASVWRGSEPAASLNTFRNSGAFYQIHKQAEESNGTKWSQRQGRGRCQSLVNTARQTKQHHNSQAALFDNRRPHVGTRTTPPIPPRTVQPTSTWPGNAHCG